MRKKSLKKYTDFIVKEAQALLAVDSPTGYTENAAAWVLEEFKKLGYAPKLTVKGGVLVKLSDGGAVSPINDEVLELCNNPTPAGGLLLEAHTDTLGGMVSKIKPDGRLELTNLGGMNANNAEAENVRIVTKYNGVYEGACQLINASVHVNGKYNDTKREWSAMEIVLDEPVKKDKDVEKLGIAVGDIVCFEPRTRVTKSGYIKSRFLDDKLSVAILLGYAMYLRDSGAKTVRPVWAHITTYDRKAGLGTHNHLRGSRSRRKRFGAGRRYGGSVRGHGLRGRGTLLHGAPGIHLRQGQRRPLQLRDSKGPDRRR